MRLFSSITMSTKTLPTMARRKTGTYTQIRMMVDGLWLARNVLSMLRYTSS